MYSPENENNWTSLVPARDTEVMGPGSGPDGFASLYPVRRLARLYSSPSSLALGKPGLVWVLFPLASDKSAIFLNVGSGHPLGRKRWADVSRYRYSRCNGWTGLPVVPLLVGDQDDPRLGPVGAIDGDGGGGLSGSPCSLYRWGLISLMPPPDLAQGDTVHDDIGTRSWR